MNLEKFIEVYKFAKEAHGEQKRKTTGDPYISHSVAVSEIARKGGGDEHTISACLLHDTVEDTLVTLEEIRERFGYDVAFLVDGVTKASNEQETLKKVEKYSRTDKRVIVVKLADRIHNMQDILNPILHKTRNRYKISSPKYIELGKELGYEELASQLEKLTNNI